MARTILRGWPFGRFPLDDRNTAVLAVHELEIRVGARVLMSDVSFRVADGDKIGLVGRNGAGKTTLTKVLAGDLLPSDGKVTSSGDLGYLPQDPRSGDPEMLARTRILDARGLGTLQLGISQASHDMASDDPKIAERAMRKFGNLTERFEAQGGYSAEAEAASIANNLSLPDRILDQPLKTLSGGQRRRIELARILFSDAKTMILDEPTNHLDIRHQLEVLALLSALSTTIIVSLHDLALASAHADRVLVLADGRQAALGAPLDILTPAAIRQTFAVETAIDAHPATGRPRFSFHLEPRS